MSVYMQSTLQCTGAGLLPFLELMKKAKPIVEAAGWRLDRAFIHNTGKFNVVVDIWELKDLNAYHDGTLALQQDPFFPEFKQGLDAYLLSEEVIFLTKTEYSP
ncbi:MAG: NIPSNAP family protein [Pseudomonadota bacterium]